MAPAKVVTTNMAVAVRLLDRSGLSSHGIFCPRKAVSPKRSHYRPPSAGMALVLPYLTHGGHASTDRDTTRFDYLFEKIVADADKHLPATDPQSTVNALKKLGSLMVEPEPDFEDPNGLIKNSPIPPIYTYWGQFIDHDITANTDRDGKVSNITNPDLVPLDPERVKNGLKNLRQPALNIDSLYGDGPFAPVTDDSVRYDGIKLKIGLCATKEESGAPGEPIPPNTDLDRDLPRRQGNPNPELNGVALVGDARNDENLIVAQVSVSFIRFHNATVDWVHKNEPNISGDKQVFSRARDLTRWTYQWLVVHDYLKTVTFDGVVDRVLNNGRDKNLLQLDRRGTYMPLEFSVASFRFGHSMVRAKYDYNRNFGRPEPGKRSILPAATLEQLFQFTGKPPAASRLQPGGSSKKATVLPFNWIIEWDRMVHKDDKQPNHFTRLIDTLIVPPLSRMANEGNDPKDSVALQKMLKQLAIRNLLRGYLLSLPTGQAVANELGIPVLTRDDLEKNSSNDMKKALDEGGFFDRTPLWFYILKDSEVRAEGKSLGEVGSTIVANTIIGQIFNDPESYLNQKNWSTDLGVKLPNGNPVKSIPDFLRFASVLE